MSRQRVLRLLGTAFALAGLVMDAGAQEAGAAAGVARSSTANYFFAETNELTITVSVLGGVARPGRYEISRKIDLLNVLSLAGGTLPDADLSEIRIVRSFEVQEHSERRNILLDIEKTAELYQLDLALQEGDFIYVPQSAGLTFSEVLSIVSSTAILTLTVLTIINMLEENQTTTTGTAPAQ